MKQAVSKNRKVVVIDYDPIADDDSNVATSLNCEWSSRACAGDARYSERGCAEARPAPTPAPIRFNPAAGPASARVMAVLAKTAALVDAAAQKRHDAHHDRRSDKVKTIFVPKSEPRYKWWSQR